MRKLLAGATLLMTVSVSGCFGIQTAAADDPQVPGPPIPGISASGKPMAAPVSPDRTAYALGGAHVLGIPYDEYIRMTGKDWFPGMKRENIWYPAGQVQGHTLERLFPGIGPVGEKILPGLGLDGTSIGESIDIGEPNLENRLREGGPGTAMGLSEGALVLNAVKSALANDPTAPPTDSLTFATFGDPIAKSPFSESFLTQNFPVGSVVPFMDYRIPAPVESQYHTDQFISAYDSIADWPDRPDNLFAVTNAIAGLATGHTAIAFTNPKMVPARNITTEVNSKGGSTTTYFIPEQHLPLVMGFKYLGVPEETLNRLDAILQPRVDAGYSRNDDPATAPITVDPTQGFDPAQVTAPASQATFGGGSDPISQITSGALAVLGNGTR
ncbi:MAG: acyltransferase PE [Mycobacterium sp.]